MALPLAVLVLCALLHPGSPQGVSHLTPPLLPGPAFCSAAKDQCEPPSKHLSLPASAVLHSPAPSVLPKDQCEPPSKHLSLPASCLLHSPASSVLPKDQCEPPSKHLSLPASSLLHSPAPSVPPKDQCEPPSKHLSLPVRPLLHTPSPATPSDESDVSFAILREGEEHFHLGHAADLVVLLGVSGSGKSTLVKFVAGDIHSLRGRRRGLDLVYDDGDKTIGNAPINSMTLYPELTLDTETGAAFVDCPGFFDTRNTSLDIAGGYFIRKVFDQARRVKILFTLAHGSVRSGYDRRGFTDMLAYAATILTDLDKYQDSVGLMLTKVDNYPPVPDDEIIHYAMEFMREAKSNLQRRIVEAEKLQLNNNMIRLIDIFIDDSNGGKIAIFRRPDKEGPVSASEFLQENKKHIREVIFNHLQFVKTSPSDFAHTLSSESKLYIRDVLLGLVDSKIQHLFQFIAQDLHRTYAQSGRQSRDIFHFKELVENDFTTLSKFNRNTLTADEVPILIATCLKMIKTSVYGELNVKDIVGYLGQSKAFRTFLSDKSNEYMHKWTEPVFAFSVYLERLKLWYTALVDVEKDLQTSQVQLKNKKYSKILANTVVTSENINTILAYLQEIPSLKKNVNLITLVTKPSNTEEFVFRDLTKILNGSLAINYECISAKHFVIFGRYLVLSDVLVYANECGTDIKSLAVYAFERVYIDMDMRAHGKELQLTIIAPSWEILGDREIVLDGLSGSPISPTKARSGSNIGESGEDGQAGNPGQPSGSFLGVGRKFTSGERLKISAVGGDGSDGQIGGDGAHGRNGGIPRLPGANSFSELHHNLVTLGYTYSLSGSSGGTNWLIWSRSWGRKKLVVTGARGTSGADGGNGGQGGQGAKAGDIRIIELDAPSNIQQVSRDGRSGSSGSGGKGGNAGSPTGTMRIHCEEHVHQVILMQETRQFDCWEEGNRKQDNFNRGQDGTAGKTPSKKPKEVQSIKISDKITVFKKYVRENIILNSVDTSFSQKSLMQIDTSDLLLSNMHPLNILQDVKEIELLYTKYKDRSDFTMIYQSELAGILHYARNPAGSTDQTRKILHYATSCVLSKLFQLQSGANRFLLVDMKTYIKRSLENVKQLQETGRKVVISGARYNYEDAIDKSIREVENLIKEHSSVEFLALGHELDKNIEELLDYNVALQKDANQHQTELIVADKKIQDQVKAKGLHNILKTYSSVLSLFNPISAAVGVFTGGFGELDPLLLGAAAKTTFYQLVLPVISKIQGAQIILKSFVTKGSGSVNSFMHFLDVISQKTNLFPEQCKQIINTIKKVKLDFLKPISSFDLPGKINRYKNSVLSDIKDAIGKLKIGASSNTDIKSLTNFLNRTKRLVPVSDSLGGHFSVEENDKLSAISRAFTENSKELKRLHDVEYQIYNTMLPTLQQVFKDFESAVTDLSDKRLPVLDISKWRIQKTLRDANLQVKAFMEDSKLEGKLLRWFSQLEESALLMIKLFDRIEQYQAQKQLAGYIAALNSADMRSITISDPATLTALNELELLIQSNMVLAQHNRISSAFKQHIFPFAQHYLRPEISVENSVFHAIESIQYIRDKLTDAQTSIINGQDEFVHIGHFTSAYETSFPFFTWDSKTYSEHIENLMLGEEVILLADVHHPKNLNAVKFSTIQLYFKAEESDKQEELDNLVKYLDVEMTHMGNSYYKCDNKYFVISSESQTISYSNERDSKREPIRKNSVYTKIQSGDILLSPYAMWRLKLVGEKRRLQELGSRFKGLVSVELRGIGQYVARGARVCSEALDQFYERYEGGVSGSHYLLSDAAHSENDKD